MTTTRYKHNCADYEICDTCWLCSACCPGPETCALATAPALDAIAGWVADEIAGGRSPKWVALQAGAGARCLAAAAREAAAT